MNTFTKNIVWLTASLVVLVVLGKMVLDYIDTRFGDGVGIIVSAILLGVFVTMAIVFFTMTAVNRTHEAAGEDLAHGIQYIIKPLAEQARIQREFARAEAVGLANRAKIEAQQAKEVQKLAGQRAKLLVDLERQKWDQSQRFQQQLQQVNSMSDWDVDDDDDDAVEAYYE